MAEKLVDIRCPNLTTKKRQGVARQEVCNRKLVEVAPGSSGEAYCWTCDYRFPFEVARDNQSIYDILKLAKPA